MSQVFFSFFFFFFLKKIGQSGGASRWRVCYQRGLPRLVSYKMHVMEKCLGVVLDEVEVQY